MFSLHRTSENQPDEAATLDTGFQTVGISDSEADEAIEYIESLTAATGRAVQRLIDRVPEYQENSKKISETLDQTERLSRSLKKIVS